MCSSIQVKGNLVSHCKVSLLTSVLNILKFIFMIMNIQLKLLWCLHFLYSIVTSTNQKKKISCTYGMVVKWCGHGKGVHDHCVEIRNTKGANDNGW